MRNAYINKQLNVWLSLHVCRLASDLDEKIKIKLTEITREYERVYSENYKKRN